MTLEYKNIKTFQVNRDNIEGNLRISSLSTPPQGISNVEVFLWKHVNSPAGASTAYCVGDNDVEGRFFVQHRLYYNFFTKKVEKIGIITDLIVSPKIKNPSILISLVSLFSNKKLSNMIFHTSNKLSDSIYRGIFKFKPIAKIKYFLIVYRGPSMSFFGQVINILFLAPLYLFLLFGFLVASMYSISFGSEPSDEDYDLILKSFGIIAQNHFSRGKVFLNWQYHPNNPLRQKIHWIYRNGKCIGYLSTRLRSMSNFKVLMVIDSVFGYKLSKLDSFFVKLILVLYAVKGRYDGVVLAGNILNPSLEWIQGFPFIQILKSHKFVDLNIYGHNLFPIKFDDHFFTLVDLD